MYEAVIERMINLGFDEDEFSFTICENDTEIEYDLGVKAIEEFSSLLLLVGNHGGGFNMVFLANDNMVNREHELKDMIIQEFAKELSGYTLVRMNE